MVNTFTKMTLMTKTIKNDTVRTKCIRAINQ